MKKSRPLVVVAVLGLALGALLVASGCSQLSVRHLNRNPWVVNTGQTLDMKFWRFDYEAVPFRNSFGVRGVARPRADRLPEWASWVEELWLAAYLSDSQGRVVAKDLLVSLPKPLSPETGVPFEFILEPEDLGDAGPLFLTFGYRMVLTPGAKGPDAKPEANAKQEAGAKGDKRKVFFANEGALTRF
ncbi:MAG: hypothetical protein H0S85_01295 [Desulfovibrionaceae bacterium]|jgi:hypothetical protein|nr:hypothetical protein [Desulfovibrionaceae bacterium]